MIMLVMLLRLLIVLRPAVSNSSYVARVRAHRRHLLGRLPPSVEGTLDHVRLVLDLVALASSLDAFVAVLVHHEVVCEQLLVVLTEPIALSPICQPESDFLQRLFVESIYVVLCEVEVTSQYNSTCHTRVLSLRPKRR